MGKESENKIGENNQYELSFESDQVPEKKVEKTWREEVGEKIFMERMRELKIGLGLWDSVVTDGEGNVLKVDGMEYNAWNKKEEELKDRPGDLYNYKNI